MVVDEAVDQEIEDMVEDVSKEVDEDKEVKRILFNEEVFLKVYLALDRDLNF